ncbi:MULTISPECIES: hypothetical protein [unclassified Actinopolyspora]|uniref:hypothetical protein n=1 Tax=Actinopolyspora TaxID=1849 RepID=UPI0013F5D6AF|nr:MULTISPECIES: hypothetical protein [unclassified Actinopolyspora]NHD16830.1 hypothetical protein [Actinopolyspora sp. BKK2]NHE75982.1 hypothetical protein [Actinopolyspora sp. BKK1]
MRCFRSTWREALTAELCWVDGTGRPRVIAATPLSDGDTPCVALPYSWLALVRELSRAEEVGFSVTDGRSLGEGSDGIVAHGPVRVREDLTGESFLHGLLEQELFKYPPSRLLADSVISRRENWWWTPRLIVEMPSPERVRKLVARVDPARHVLAVGGDSARPEVTTVSIDGLSADRVKCSTPAESEPLRAGSGVLFAHDYTASDFERWESWRAFGWFSGDELLIEHREGGVPGRHLAPLGLLERIRRRHRLAKECRRAIVAAERGG